MNESIRDILIRRDGISPTEADELIAEAREALQEYIAEGDLERIDNICMDFFGLEPDYIEELL